MLIYFSGTPGRSMGLPEDFVEGTNVMLTFHDIKNKQKLVWERLKSTRKRKERHAHLSERRER